MKTVPEISVIIPVYNVEKFLPQALDSLLSQTFADFEAVCVNDGSSDNCAEILAAYASKDSRLRIISRNNQGVSAARNAALDVARGNYIVFLDPDDLIHVRFLEIMLEQIKRTNADFVWCDTIRFNDVGADVNAPLPINGAACLLTICRKDLSCRNGPVPKPHYGTRFSRPNCSIICALKRTFMSRKILF